MPELRRWMALELKRGYRSRLSRILLVVGVVFGPTAYMLLSPGDSGTAEGYVTWCALVSMGVAAGTAASSWQQELRGSWLPTGRETWGYLLVKLPSVALIAAFWFLVTLPGFFILQPPYTWGLLVLSLTALVESSMLAQVFILYARSAVWGTLSYLVSLVAAAIVLPKAGAALGPYVPGVMRFALDSGRVWFAILLQICAAAGWFALGAMALTWQRWRR